MRTRDFLKDYPIKFAETFCVTTKFLGQTLKLDFSIEDSSCVRIQGDCNKYLLDVSLMWEMDVPEMCRNAARKIRQNPDKRRYWNFNVGKICIARIHFISEDEICVFYRWNDDRFKPEETVELPGGEKYTLPARESYRTVSKHYKLYDSQDFADRTSHILHYHIYNDLKLFW